MLAVPKWPPPTIYDHFDFDVVLPHCIRESGINQDILDDFINDSDVDRFASDEILKDYTYCLWTGMHLINVATGSMQFHVFLDFFDELDAQVKTIFIMMSKGCFSGALNQLNTRERIYSIVLCMKRNDPIVSTV